MSTTTQPFSPGDVVEFVSDDGPRRASKGDRMIVELCDPGFQPGDEEYGDDDYMQGPIIEGVVNGGDVETEAKHVRLVMRASDVKHPTREEVAQAVTIDDFRHDGDWFVHTEEVDGAVRTSSFTDRETGR